MRRFRRWGEHRRELSDLIPFLSIGAYLSGYVRKIPNESRSVHRGLTRPEPVTKVKSDPAEYERVKRWGVVLNQTQPMHEGRAN
jgi:hypothetical protein